MSLEAGEKLVEKLAGDPANVARQLRAMAGVGDTARQMHRFDEYLLAGAQIITALSSERDLLREALERARGLLCCSIADVDSTMRRMYDEAERQAVLDRIDAALTGVTGG